MGHNHGKLAGLDRAGYAVLREHGPACPRDAGISAGTAYAIWTGLGAVGVIIGGVILFGERVTPLQAGFMVMIVIGVVGTKLTSV